jgi:NitT/TauT family transport system permease protein
MGGGLTSAPKIQNMKEVFAIIAVAVVIIGGAELLLRIFDVKEFVMPTPSAIVTALFVHFDEIGPTWDSPWFNWLLATQLAHQSA